MLYENNGYVQLDYIPIIAFDLRIEEEVVKRVIDNYELFEKDDARFYSSSILKRLELRQEKSEKAKNSANARWNKQNESESNINEMRTHTESNAIKEKENKSKVNNNIYIKESKEKSFDTHGFETFVKKYNINFDNYSADFYDLDFERLDNAFSESDFLKENFISLSKICREYERIIGGYYKDFTKPKGKAVPKTETDREFLIRKQYSEEYVDSLTAEELKAKAKRLRGD